MKMDDIGRAGHGLSSLSVTLHGADPASQLPSLAPSPVAPSFLRPSRCLCRIVIRFPHLLLPGSSRISHLPISHPKSPMSGPTTTPASTCKPLLLVQYCTRILYAPHSASSSATFALVPQRSTVSFCQSSSVVAFPLDPGKPGTLPWGVDQHCHFPPAPAPANETLGFEELVSAASPRARSFWAPVLYQARGSDVQFPNPWP